MISVFETFGVPVIIEWRPIPEMIVAVLKKVGGSRDHWSRFIAWSWAGRLCSRLSLDHFCRFLDAEVFPIHTFLDEANPTNSDSDRKTQLLVLLAAAPDFPQQ